MRLFLLFVLTSLLKLCTTDSAKKITGTIKVEFGLYCPIKTNWEYKISSQARGDPAIEVSGKVTGNMEFRTLENVFTTSSGVSYCWEDTCTTDGKWQSCVMPYFYRPEENKITYRFLGLNLKSMLEDEHVFEKLSAHFLEKECRTGDCSDIRDRVAVYCGQVSSTTFKPKCMSSFEKGLKVFLENRPPSSPPPISISADATTGESSNKTTLIVIGSVVGVVLLISLIVTFFLCKKKKKASKQTGSGMSGTGTGSNTMTKSVTTKQGTTTGTFQKTRTVGTGNTGNTTTGGERY